jgi:hypothetical protein
MHCQRISHTTYFSMSAFPSYVVMEGMSEEMCRVSPYHKTNIVLKALRTESGRLSGLACMISGITWRGGRFASVFPPREISNK